MKHKNLIFTGVCLSILLLAFAAQSMSAEGKEKARTMPDQERAVTAALLEQLPEEQREQAQKDMETFDEKALLDLFLVKAKEFSGKN